MHIRCYIICYQIGYATHYITRHCNWWIRHCSWWIYLLMESWQDESSQIYQRKMCYISQLTLQNFCSTNLNTNQVEASWGVMVGNVSRLAFFSVFPIQFLQFKKKNCQSFWGEMVWGCKIGAHEPGTHMQQTQQVLALGPFPSAPKQWK